MAEFTFGQMLESAGTAAAESGSTADIDVTPGTYTATIVFTNSKRTGTGKLSVGAKFRIDTEGPCKGGGVWMNQYLSPDSPKALDIWFRTFETLGVPRAHWGSFGAELDAAGADVATRIKGVTAQIIVEIDGTFGAKVKAVRPAPNPAQTQSAPWGTGQPAAAGGAVAAAPTRPAPAF